MPSQWTEHSLGFAPQTAFGTARGTDGDFRYFEAEVPKVTFTTEAQELDLMTGQFTASPERIIGRRHGSLSFSMPLEGMAEGWEPGEDGVGDGVPHWACLLANAMGCDPTGVDLADGVQFWQGFAAHISAATAGGVASGSASDIVVDSVGILDTVASGQLVVVDTPTPGLKPLIAWIQKKLSTAVTFFEDARNPPDGTASADTVFGSFTMWTSPKAVSPIPLTARWMGQETGLCYVLEDVTIEQFKISWNSGEVPILEVQARFYNYSMDTSLGGLQVPVAHDRIPAILGSKNGMVKLNGETKCGLEACEIVWKASSVRENKCHAADSGVSGVQIVKPRVSVSFTVPHSTDDAVYDAGGGIEDHGQHQWQSDLELGVTVSVGVYVGTKLGRIFSFLIPALRLTATPSPELQDNVLVYKIQGEAAAYNGDETDDTDWTSSNSPMNSVARIGLA